MKTFESLVYKNITIDENGNSNIEYFITPDEAELFILQKLSHRQDVHPVRIMQQQWVNDGKLCVGFYIVTEITAAGLQKEYADEAKKIRDTIHHNAPKTKPKQNVSSIMIS